MSFTATQVASQEGITVKTLYNILHAFKYVEDKRWRGWIFRKKGQKWVCEKWEERQN